MPQSRANKASYIPAKLSHWNQVPLRAQQVIEIYTVRQKLLHTHTHMNKMRQAERAQLALYTPPAVLCWNMDGERFPHAKARRWIAARSRLDGIKKRV